MVLYLEGVDKIWCYNEQEIQDTEKPQKQQEKLKKKEFDMMAAKEEKRSYFGCVIPMYHAIEPGDSEYYWNDEMGLILLTDTEQPLGPVQIIKINGQVPKDLKSVEDIVDEIVYKTVTHQPVGEDIIFRDCDTIVQAASYLNEFARRLGWVKMK